MQCTTTREQLLAPVTHVEKSTGKNLTVPVLGCVMLRVTDSVLTLTATNLEVGVEYAIPVLDTADGCVAVPGGVLVSVVSSLPSGASLTLEATEGSLLIKSAGGNASIALQDTEDFPALPKVEGGVEVTVPAGALQEALSSVSYCASNSTIKPELASVFVHPQGSVMVAVATDSFRLAEKKVSLKDAVTAEPFLIPARSVHDLLRMLEQVDDTVTLVVGEHQLSLACGGVYMTLRLTQGTFPDYTAILPKEFVAEATVLVSDLERILKKAAIFSDQFNQATVTVDPKKKEFSIHAENATVGESTDQVSAALTGDALTIRFNQRYLLDALQSVHTDSVVVQFSGSSSPALVKPIGDESFQYLVMPMNR